MRVAGTLYGFSCCVFFFQEERKKQNRQKTMKEPPRKSHRGKLLPQKLNLLAQCPKMTPHHP